MAGGEAVGKAAEHVIAKAVEQAGVRDAEKVVAREGEQAVAKEAERSAARESRTLADLFKDGRTPKASELGDWAERQGWTRTQTENGPPKYLDQNGVRRVTVKRGTPRAPGSEHPHVELRDKDGQRIDPNGNPVNRRDPGNHTPIDWDLD